MATTSSFGFRRFKAAFTAIATTAVLSTVSSVTPAIAAEPEQLNIKQLLSSDNPSIADLAGAIAQVEERIAEAEAAIGSHREAVNRALVDLNDARTKAEQARRGTTTAREQLSLAEDEVAQAQAKLNDISRSAYRRANTSDSVSRAAGKDARSDMLERQALLRSQSDKQQGVLAQLEQERTKKANKESQLRKTQQLAERREEQATEAEASARQTLTDSEASIEESAAERVELLSQLTSLHEALNQAKSVDEEETSTVPTGPSVQDESLTEADRGVHGTTAPVTEDPAAEDQPTEEAKKSEEPSASSSAPASVATEESTVAEGPTAVEARNRTLQAQQTSPSVSPEQMKELSSAADTLSSDPNVKELSSKSADRKEHAGGSSFDPTSLDPETVALGIGVVGSVASIVAASQPSHSNSLTPDEIDALAQGSSKLFALQSEQSPTATSQSVSNQEASASTADTTISEETSTESTANSWGTRGEGDSEDEDSLASDVLDVLEELETTDSITDKATSKLGDASREAKIETVIQRATSQVGVPYAWGGGDANGPTQGIRDGGVADSHGDYNKIGFDCSGLVLYAFAGVGISLPHYTGYQYQKGEKIPTSEMERGDLIFYGPSGNQHVAIYLGDGTMVEAPQSGQNVSITPVRQGGMSPYAVRLL